MYEHNRQLREIKLEVSQDYHFEEEIIHLVEGWNLFHGQEKERHKTFDKENCFATFIKDSSRLI